MIFVNFISRRRKTERRRTRNELFMNEIRKVVKLTAKFFRSGRTFS